MNPIILRGTKQEIADSLMNLTGDVNEAIVFVADTKHAAAAPQSPLGEDIFAEMQPNMVEIASIDESREAIYTRQAGE